LLLIGAGAFHIGFLNSISNLAAALVQLASAELTQFFGSRKRFIGLSVLLQSLVIAAMVAFVFSGKAHIGLFIGLVILFVAFGNISNPAWVSFLSDLVDVEQRGAYFGWRGQYLGFLTVAVMAFAGFFVDGMGRLDSRLGFGLIFAAALICRVLSYFMLGKMYEPPLAYKREDQFSFFMFFGRIKESNFVKFVLFVALMNFSVNLAAPFFAVLMIRDLSFSYGLYTAIIITAPLTVYLTIQRWGRHADRTGNLKIIKLCARLITLLPLLWVVNRHPAYLLAVEVFSGFLWAGFNLCTVNYIFDAVSPEKRTRCLAYFSVVNGLGLALGALCGGALVNDLPPLFGYQILSLFLVSTFCRFLVSCFFIRLVKEVRKAEPARSIDIFFSMIGMRPILGVDRRRVMRM
jgi:MFS family permease